jgi:type I restriction enzyme S subunit
VSAPTMKVFGNLLRIGDCVQSIDTWNPRSLTVGTFRYIDLSAIDQLHKSITMATTISTTDAPSRARQLVRAGDVLVSTVRPNLNAVARVPSDFDGATASTGFCVLRADEVRLSGVYLFHWLRTRNFISEMTRRATGASYPAVSDAIVKESLMPVPAIEEQRRIAVILDKADALRANRRLTLSRMELLWNQTFLGVFGDPAENPHGFPMITAGEALSSGLLLDVQDGNHGESHPKVSDFVTTGVPFITANCLEGDGLNTKICYFLPEPFLRRLRVGFSTAGDVLLSHKGSVGQVQIVPSSVRTIVLSPQVTYYRTNPEHIAPAYLAAYFRTAFFQARLELMSKQSTRAYVGITRQQKLPLLIPPLPLQARFAEITTSLGKLRGVHRQSETKFSELFTSLQHRAFRGDL